MKRINLSIFVILMFQSMSAQNINFQAPLDIPLLLSGNFAELRSDHFHSGLDFKTQGVTGHKVRAVEDGYVSRIKIQTNGYGKSIYINHPNGYTSVYGHLSAYNTLIAEFVKRYQYNNQTHTLDIYPSRDEISVKKGDIIALSGNSGSSGGPHLHFEVRNSTNQHPLNGLNFNFNIIDNIRPRVYNLYLYSLKGSKERQTVSGRRQFILKNTGGKYSLKDDQKIEVVGKIGFGINVNDFLDGSPNRCGVYTMELFVNDEAIFSFKTDEFSFSESRYINSHTDYSLRIQEKKRVHRLFKLPNNSLSMVKHDINNGVFNFESGMEYDVEIVVEDAAGNQSALNFKVVAAPPASPLNNKITKEDIRYWDEQNTITNHIFKLIIPKKSLYEDAEIKYSRISGATSVHEWIHNVGNPEIPLHSGAELYLSTVGIDKDLLPKICIVNFDEDNNPQYAGGEIDGEEWIKTKIYEFGSFSIDVDTIAPEIQSIKSNNALKFLVIDDLSGISKYEGFIDNEWALFEYDPKNDRISYYYDAARLNKGTIHEVELYITDNKGNTALYHSSFYW